MAISFGPTHINHVLADLDNQIATIIEKIEKLDNADWRRKQQEKLEEKLSRVEAYRAIIVARNNLAQRWEAQYEQIPLPGHDAETGEVYGARARKAVRDLQRDGATLTVMGDGPVANVLRKTMAAEAQ